jgi:hypothetical protein
VAGGTLVPTVAAADGTSSTFLIGEAMGGARIAVRLLEPASFDALTSATAPGSILVRVGDPPAGGLPAALGRARPVSRVELREESARGPRSVRLFDVLVERADPAGTASARGETYRLRYRRIEGDPDRPLVQGRVPNPGAGDEETPRLGSVPAAGAALEVDVLRGGAATAALPARIVAPAGFLAALRSGRPGGAGEAELEGDQCLVFFLGGVPAAGGHRLPELRLRTREGKEVVLARATVHCGASSGPGRPQRTRVTFEGFAVR